MTTTCLPATPDERAAVEAAPIGADWRLVQELWRAGLTDGGLYRLLRLRVAYRQTSAAADGLAAEPRAGFARWLVATGRLSEFGGHRSGVLPPDVPGGAPQ